MDHRTTHCRRWRRVIDELRGTARAAARLAGLPPSDPEFFVFRARLQRAVAAHDTGAVMRVVSPSIRVSLGGNNGRGWVLQEYLRSPITYRAGFLRRQGRWSLRWLLAGD